MVLFNWNWGYMVQIKARFKGRVNIGFLASPKRVVARISNKTIHSAFYVNKKLFCDVYPVEKLLTAPFHHLLTSGLYVISTCIACINVMRELNKTCSLSKVCYQSRQFRSYKSLIFEVFKFLNKSQRLPFWTASYLDNSKVIFKPGTPGFWNYFCLQSVWVHTPVCKSHIVVLSYFYTLMKHQLCSYSVHVCY